MDEVFSFDVCNMHFLIIIIIIIIIIYIIIYAVYYMHAVYICVSITKLNFIFY